MLDDTGLARRDRFFCGRGGQQADDGFEGLETLPTRRFDLIITDINMPDINGLELIGFVKSKPSHTNQAAAK